MDELALLDALAGIDDEPAAPARAGEDPLLVVAAVGEEDAELEGLLAIAAACAASPTGSWKTYARSRHGFVRQATDGESKTGEGAGGEPVQARKVATSRCKAFGAPCGVCPRSSRRA